MSPKVSVIIPTYNRAKFVCESIESVLGQTFEDFELIVVDDGSDDGTKELLEQYRSDGRFKYFYQSNRGRSAARNAGISASSGEWLIFLDSDDRLKPDAIRTFLSRTQEFPEADVVVGRAEYIDAASKRIEGPYGPAGEKPAKGFFRRPYLRVLRDLFFSNGNSIVRAKFIKENGILFDPAFSASEDTDFAQRIAVRGNIYDTADILQQIRFHASNTANSEVRRQAADVGRKHLAEVLPQLPESERSPAKARIYLNIGDSYFLRGHNLRALRYYLASLRYDLNVVVESNVVRQIFTSCVPARVLRFLRYIRRGEWEN